MHFDKPTATLAQPYYWVHHRDPSIDQNAEGFSQSALSEALLANRVDLINGWIKPGRKGPTRFKVQHLPAAIMRALSGFMEQHGFPLAAHRAVALALLAVENPDGQPVELDRSARDATFLAPCLSDQTMEMLERAGCDEGLETGEVVNWLGAAILNAEKKPGNSRRA